MASAKKTAVTSLAHICVSASLLLPLSSSAVVTTGYEEFGNTAGVVLWRATQGTFHNSTVADVAADGTVGTAYAMTADQSAKSWQRFAQNQAAYSAPGKVLVYDETGYTPSSDAQFGPLSFGGIWVKALPSTGEYTIAGTGDRFTDFGYAGYSTLFRFDKSFTINRANDTRCFGSVTINVAYGAVFTDVKALWIEANSKLSLTGSGEIDLSADNSGLFMNPSSTLDLSSATRPTITGNVTLEDGATIALPAGTAVGSAISFAVCSGTLTPGTRNLVKIGDAAAIYATLTTENGAIVRIDSAEQTFTSNFPNVVPAGEVYVFEGGATVGAMATANDVEVNGILKTKGYMELTDLEVKNGATLEVVSGETVATAKKNGYNDCLIAGNLIIRSGATLVPTQTDFLDWYGASGQTVDIYGTLNLGSTRWSIEKPAKCTLNLYPGARVEGSGDGNGAIDLVDKTSQINVYRGETGGVAVIEGKLRTRNVNTPIWVAADTTLTIGGGITQGGISKTGKGTMAISGPISGAAAASTLSEGTIAFNDATGTALPLTVNAGKSVVATASNGVTVPLNLTADASANVAVSGEGTVNGTITLSGKPTGTLSGLTNSTWKGTVNIPELVSTSADDPVNASFLVNCGNENSMISLAGISGVTTYVLSSGTTFDIGGVSIDGYVEFNNGASGSTANFAKITGDADLCLGAWSIHSPVAYNFNEFNEYNGTLIVSNFNKNASTFTVGIGNIVKPSIVLGEPLLSHREFKDSGAQDTIRYTFGSGKVPDDPSCILVNGVSTNLCFVKNDGIYIAAAKIGNEGYKSVQDAINARRRGKKGDIVIVDGTAEIPEGYINYNGTVIRNATIIRLH